MSVTKDRIFLVILIFVPLIVFLNNLNGGWILDDYSHIANNPFIRSFTHIPHILTSRLWRATGADIDGSEIYRPVQLLSWLFNYKLFGGSPFSFHFVNNLLHIANVLLLFSLARRFLLDSIAFAASLFFAVHPMVVEAVTWLAGRQDLLVAFFALVFVHALDQSLMAKGRARAGWVFLAMIAIPLGIFSKETFAFVPFGVIGAYAVTLRRNRAQLKALGLFWGLTVLALFLCFLWRRHILTDPVASLVGLQNISNFNLLVERFFTLLVYPADSDFVNAFQPTPFSWKGDGVVFLGMATVLGSTLWIFKKNRGALLALSFFLLSLLPITLVLDSLGWIAERYFYLPMAGFAFFCGIVAKSFGHFWSPSSKRVRVGFVCELWTWFFLLGLASISRNQDWKNEEAIYASSLSRSPDNYLPYYFLACHYDRDGNRQKEMEFYRWAIQKKPDYRPALNNLAVRLIDQKAFAEAKEILMQAYRVGPRVAKTSFNIGYYYERKGDRSNAKKWYSQALRLKSNYLLATQALARVE